MGIIMERRRRALARRRRGGWVFLALALLGAALVTAPKARGALRGAMDAVSAFSRQEQAQVTLPAWEVCALQLAVFDSGERAASEAGRLQSAGVRCIVWQRERMRIVCSVARTKEALDASTAKGRDAYVIRDVLEEMTLSVGGRAAQVEAASALLRAPDDALGRLLDGGEPLETVVSDARRVAQQAQRMRAQNELHAQLAQGLIGWCELMDKSLQEDGDARSYACVTMYTLCRELRASLKRL